MTFVSPPTRPQLASHFQIRRGLQALLAFAAVLFPRTMCIAQENAPNAGTVQPPESTNGDVAAESEVQDANTPPAESQNIYALLDLEELMAVTVTSATGVATPWFRTPAAMHVLTAEDIRRAGHRSIPESLRLVPGLHVARVDSGVWAISSRGFSSEFANKLQVLMDGRRIYDPLFSGVYWDVVDYVMEDIDRIEAIRGPGATLWGANAVNGVLNITTKPAAETQGLLMTGGSGTFEQGFGAVRYGGQISDDAHFRIYSKYRTFDHTPSLSAGERPDDWYNWQGGFRFDFGRQDEGLLTLQGDVFHLPERGTRGLLADPTGHFEFMSGTGSDRATGGNFLVRLHQPCEDESSWTIQAYYDRFDRALSRGFRYTRDSFDLDFRRHLRLGDRHEVLWGLNFRSDSLASDNTFEISLNPSSRHANTFSAFVQDTITIVPDRLFTMIGAKLEHNDFSGFEVQPSARLWWTPDDRQTLWASVSRPVRTPSWVEQDLSFLTAYADPGLLAPPFIPLGFTVPLFLTGSRQVESETMLSWEAGYRRRIADALTVDIAGFYNLYRDLVDLDGLGFANVGRADVYGLEVAATWKVADNWDITGSYSSLRIDSGDSFSGASWEGSSPRHQFQLHSRLDITRDLEFNAGLYFVDALRNPGVGDHTRLDLGLTWRPQHNIELSIWGQNLLEPSHMEFDSSAFMDSPALVERSVALQATIRF